MKLTVILLIFCLVLAVSARGAGGRSGGRSFGGGRSIGGSRVGSKSLGSSRTSLRSQSISRAVPRPQPRPAPPKPVIKAPPKPQPKPVPPKPVIKVQPKPQLKPAPPKPIVKTPAKPQPKPAPAVKNPPKPIIKPALPKPAKPVVKPPLPAVKLPAIKPVAKSQPKPAPAVKNPPKPITKPAPPNPAKPAAKPPGPAVKVPAIKPVVKTPPKTDAKSAPKTEVKVPIKTNNPPKSPNKPLVTPAKTSPKNPVPIKTEPTTGSISVNQNFASNGVKQVGIEANKKVWESDNKRHSIDVNAQATKIQSKGQGNPKTDITVGGQYNYNTDKTSISASASGKPRQGADLNIDARQNLWQSKNERHSIDANAAASKHVGGPQGTTKTDLTIGGQYNYNNDKTQITASANGKPKQGVDLKLGAEHKIWQSENQRHSITGNAEVSKHIGGPLGNEKPQVNFGGQYKYEGDKTQITAGVNGSPGQGATASVEARHNLYQSADKHTRIDATAGISKQIGGPNGNARPDAQVGVSVNYDF
ncbi:uncharacterized protein LOC142230055 isoform X3 [Haematobia irritans]|uniref:uncharacterized protein LOC142230055 isoform X3 n=1 Tax=Haematobia irritans TaxID=7368 RepID=UPI003F4FFDFE